MQEGMPDLAVSLSIGDKDLISAPRNFAEFFVNVKNIGNNPTKKIRVYLKGPELLKLPIKIRTVNYLAPGKAKNLNFKVRSDSEGLFDLEIEVMINEVILTNLPFKFRVGIYHPKLNMIYKAPQRDRLKKQEFIEPMIICPNCEKQIKKKSRFCAYCGYNLTKQIDETQKTIKCPHCNALIDEGLKICSECGKEVSKILKTPIQ